MSDATQHHAPAGDHKKVLVVEDSVLIALDLEETLLEAGYNVVGPTGTVDSALALIESDPIDVALLDINLGENSSFPLARKLQSMEIQFAFLTGYSTQNGIPPEFLSSPILEKPLREQELLKTLEQLVQEPLSN